MEKTTKQCIVFIDDIEELNSLQVKELGQFISKTYLCENSDSCYSFNSGHRTIDVSSKLVQLRRKEEGKDGEAAIFNKNAMNALADELKSLKEKYDTFLPIVDLCLAGSKKLDSAWSEKDVIDFLYKLDCKIVLVVSTYSWSLNQLAEQNKEKKWLLMRRPDVNDEYTEFNKISSPQSVVEESYFAEILLNNLEIISKINKELFRKIGDTQKMYEKYFYSILMANEISMYLER